MTSLKLPELVTRSVLNVVEENYEKLGLKSFASRMIYIGEHTLSKEEIINHFKTSVQDTNSCYCDITVQGLLLVYDSYFVHIVEGSEDTIHRQIRFVFQRERDWIVEQDRLEEEAKEAARIAAIEEAAEQGISFHVPDEPKEPEVKVEKKMFKKLKMLMTYHCISTLIIDGWNAISARPRSLVGKLNLHGSRDEHIEQLSICLAKLSQLCDMAKTDENLSFEGLSAADPKMDALPEVALLDFLLQSSHILDLREVAKMHRRVDDYIFYYESVWPLQTHFTPRFLYKLKIDDSFVPPLPVMPWEIKKEITEDDEEKLNSSSDSD